MKERLMQFLKAKNLTSTRLADEIGVQRSSISHILSGRNKPSYDFIYKFLQHYRDISPQWLILGDGPMYTGKSKQTALTFNDEPERSTSHESDVQQNAAADVPEEQLPENDHDTEPEQKKEPHAPVKKIILLYSDNHFEEYGPAH